MRFIRIGFLGVVSFFVSDSLFAQRHHHRRDMRVVVVKHSRHRPRRIVVFRPHWHSHLTCQRRWVYFPRYNFYWDNWRDHFLYFNGAMWVSKSNPPANAEGVALAEERFYELNEADDDNDDIALANAQHQERYRGN